MTEQKAAAEKTGLQYDPTIEYWQDIQVAWIGTDPVLIGIGMMKVAEHAKAESQAKLNKDIDYLNERIAAIQKTYEEWVDRPAAPAELGSLQALLVDSLKHWKPLADDALAAANQSDWETYFKDLDSLADYDRATKFVKEVKRVAKHVHLTSLVGP
jgi:hypothetical protein